VFGVSVAGDLWQVAVENGIGTSGYGC
jgi:hypothetical protein